MEFGCGLENQFKYMSGKIVDVKIKQGITNVTKR
jgi:hypothetical protein